MYILLHLTLFVLAKDLSKSPKQEAPKYTAVSRSTSHANVEGMRRQNSTDAIRRSDMIGSPDQDIVNYQATPDITYHREGLDSLDNALEEHKLNTQRYEPRNDHSHLVKSLSSQRSGKMNFDEYLVEYERFKNMEQKKVPAEHRSKYMNDVFSSSLNLGAGNSQTGSHQIHKVVDQMLTKGKSHYTPSTHLTSSMSGKLHHLYNFS